MSSRIRRRDLHVICLCVVGLCSLIGWLCGCNHQPNKAQAVSDQQPGSTTAFTADELLNELRIRAARNRLADKAGKGFPPTAEIVTKEVEPGEASFPQGDPRLKHMSTESIYDHLIQIQAQYMGTTGRKEWYEVDQPYKDDVKSVVCLVKSSRLVNFTIRLRNTKSATRNSVKSKNFAKRSNFGMSPPPRFAPASSSDRNWLRPRTIAWT
jgi:hypothetical protein